MALKNKQKTGDAKSDEVAVKASSQSNLVMTEGPPGIFNLPRCGLGPICHNIHCYQFINWDRFSIEEEDQWHQVI